MSRQAGLPEYLHQNGDREHVMGDPINPAVVLTHGLIKKPQKTPQRKIERAEAYRRDYLQRRLKK